MKNGFFFGFKQRNVRKAEAAAFSAPLGTIEKLKPRWVLGGRRIAPSRKRLLFQSSLRLQLKGADSINIHGYVGTDEISIGERSLLKEYE